MAVPMQSTNFRNTVAPILSKTFDGIYDQRKDEHKAIFTTITGTPRDQHVEPVFFGFNAAPLLPDGTAVDYDAGGTLFTKFYTYDVYGLAFALTRVLIEDGNHINMGKIYSKHLAQSIIETKETICANVLNRAFNNSYPGGDGVSLVNASHPIANGATFSNVLTASAALSQTSLEALITQMRSATDANGKKINVSPGKLVVPPQLMLQAEVLLKSALRTGGANNDINPVQTVGSLEPNPVVISRLTSSTAWFIKSSDVQMGLQVVTRRPIAKSMEGDFDTDSMRYKVTERYAVGFTAYLDCWGTPAT